MVSRPPPFSPHTHTLTHIFSGWSTVVSQAPPPFRPSTTIHSSIHPSTTPGPASWLLLMLCAHPLPPPPLPPGYPRPDRQTDRQDRQADMCRGYHSQDGVLGDAGPLSLSLCLSPMSVPDTHRVIPHTERHPQAGGGRRSRHDACPSCRFLFPRAPANKKKKVGFGADPALSCVHTMYRGGGGGTSTPPSKAPSPSLPRHKIPCMYAQCRQGRCKCYVGVSAM